MSKGNILIVDDNPANIQLLASLLARKGYEARPTNSGKRALEAARNAKPDLVLLDIMMPEMDGYETATVFKEDLSLRDVPIIFLSALDELTDKVRAFEVGGVDYITKPFQTREVLARIDAHLQIVRQKEEIAELRTRELANLEQLNQLKDDVLSIVSHDLKNPLGIILGYSEILQESLQDRDQLTERDERQIQGILRAANQMLSLVHDLLDMARMEGSIDLSREWISVNGFLKDCYQDFELVAQGKSHSFVLDKVSDTTEFYVDPQRLYQAISNLVSNAIKYTPENGTITLGASLLDDHLEIYVKDSGEGISKEDLPRLFDKFYRVDRSLKSYKSGTGLGLSIVKSVIEQHQGNITVDSIEGKGSNFVITLPVATEDGMIMVQQVDDA